MFDTDELTFRYKIRPCYTYYRDITLSYRQPIENYKLLPPKAVGTALSADFTAFSKLR